MSTNPPPKSGDFAPYELLPTGFEATYTGQTDVEGIDTSDAGLTYWPDADGHLFMQYSLWGFAYTKTEDWTDEIRAINRLQDQLGPLDDETRAIRAHIASLVPCDSGVPVTIDEILNAIGTGHLPEPAFHPGCWLSRGRRSTQPHQVESMRIIESVLRGYLEGQAREGFIAQYPYAAGFVDRAYAWAWACPRVKRRPKAHDRAYAAAV